MASNFRGSVRKKLSKIKTYSRDSQTIRDARKILASEADALQDIETFCCFIGQPRSGHSLVGALLNAHPNIVIAHECDILRFLDKGLDKEMIFAILLHRDHWFTNEIGSNWTGYSYAVPNQYQGRFDTLKVIGDKKGGITATRLYEDPECLNHLYDVVQTPFRIINHIRDPFDSISTEWKKFQEPPERPDTSLQLQIDLFFQRTEAIAGVKNGPLSDFVYDAWHEDFISDPRSCLKSLVSFLGEEASDAYLTDCTSIIFNKAKKTRLSAPWTDSLRDRVNQLCKNYSFLERYSH